MTRLTSFVGILTFASVSAFSQHSTPRNQQAKLQDSGDVNVVAKALATAAMTAFLWAAPMPLTHELHGSSYIANAVEKASGTGSRVNKDADSLLRLGLPIKNKEVRGLQETLETIKYDIGSKRKSAALDGVKKSKSYLTGKTAEKMKASCRSPSVCASLITEIDSLLDPLQASMKQSQDAFTGSEQERTALDKAYDAQQKATTFLTDLEEQMIPENYETPVPSDYSDLPRLTKRATVEMVVKKAEAGAQFDVNGVNFPEAKMTMVIDGYTAPITGGNFVDLVNKGFYTNMAIQRSDGFVVQTGDPDGKAVGYVGTPGKAIGAGPNGERLIPTEIFVRGDKGPFYESTIEDEGRGGEATILPFSAYGAMGWAREEYDVNSGSSQFFWLLFDSDLTPAGKNVLDGRYPCFGYVVEGSDFLSDIKEGDVIVSAKVTKGLENLVEPKA
ncbi:unnamed protein product [Cylindrotheca closterium]|uniref:peptidylprolyl isomerase n=1 Tax=Cylindrotheca closterium TaxID=2856 RepID=A0AAD2G4Q1_9STRA|nr:unnamed protein product [Cylindrotheca closterium]